MSYHIRNARNIVELSAGWDSPCWADVEPIKIEYFRPESSDHRPVVRCKLQHDDFGLYGLFQVQDRFVRCVADHFQDSVCQDSCVELFIEPPGSQGYFNFEFSGNGQYLIYHVRDARRTSSGFADYSALTAEEGAKVKVFHTLPDRVEPELAEPVTWRLGFFIPFSLIAGRVGITRPVHNQTWRANLFKCGDQTSHPHWASWQLVEELNFHAPESFAPVVFD
ncbi:carbohydrate-binding family 9-like protein [Victivallis sp. Marseille-Q1083]|uniref:carbohydrate-binding family 9-like protein n=1 Tax=Victivallis sp. Marseille-Q1083 TaxID=2717288 RepID=UPI00158B5347|nr:carbohydrate-binding family 9-like protein [Victivallis sp. Marseille-Q1083]